MGLQAFTVVLLILLQASVTKPAAQATVGETNDYLDGNDDAAGADGDDDDDDDDDFERRKSRRKGKSGASGGAGGSDTTTFPACLYNFVVSFTDKAMTARKECVH